MEAFSDVIPRENWGELAPRAEIQTRRTLELLESHKVKGTYFVLGWMAERNPSLVKEIHDAGHEIASHGFSHKMITRMGREEFREDVRRSKMVLEEITQTEVQGYGPPPFPSSKAHPGHTTSSSRKGTGNSSSVYPIRHDGTDGPISGGAPAGWHRTGMGRSGKSPCPSVPSAPSGYRSAAAGTSGSIR